MRAMPFLFLVGGLFTADLAAAEVQRPLSCADLMDVASQQTDHRAREIVADLFSVEPRQIQLRQRGILNPNNFANATDAESTGMASFLYAVEVDGAVALVDASILFIATSIATAEGPVARVKLAFGGIRRRDSESAPLASDSPLVNPRRSHEAHAMQVTRRLHQFFYLDEVPREFFGVEWNGTFGVYGLVEEHEQPYAAIGYTIDRAVVTYAVFFNEAGDIREIRALRPDSGAASERRVDLRR